ncbi:MAG: 3-oxoacyl-ACP synthase [Syntrophobacterales bacterium CG_4_8_14_3_um_filter_49_14]|nr:MAG: 3-oxoacyl-ACP synthase [Syntrophobacterales bacterium CG_4_9_14_3_um_filter_49_8]PJC73583.1 MAG: 3-oxoacyl-ACP synthase [Syntrophobacterales bacterium CG_4_8_14_3_um_filter_49_14]
MRKQSKTGWTKIKAMKDRDIDFSDVPELDDNFFAEATLWPGKKKQITIRLDSDVVDFFKTKGRGYQSSINATLRRYMEAQQRRLKST